MEITRKGQAIPLEGTVPTVGEAIPSFSLTTIEGETVSNETLKGQLAILSVFPDINTSVCDQQTRTFNEKAANIDNIQLISVSRNTKEELKNWCAAQGLDMEMWIDDKGEFGQAFGINMPSLDKLARSVFVITADGLLAYKEIVPEMVEEPNYDAAIGAAKDLL